MLYGKGQTIMSKSLECLHLSVVLLTTGLTASPGLCAGGSGEDVKGSQFVDVRRDLTSLDICDRNAAGDGKTDDSEAVRAAIGYVAKHGGGKVLVPPGIYCIADIQVIDSVDLVGTGVEETVFRAAYPCTAVIWLKGGSIGHLTVYGTPRQEVSGENWAAGEKFFG